MENDKIIKAILASHSLHWVHNANHTNDIEALRRICLDYSAWWNFTAWPLVVELAGGEEEAEQHFQHTKNI